MRHVMTVLAWLCGFVVLDLYVNLVPRWVGFAMPAWLTYVAGFLALAWAVCRHGLGIRQFATVGLGRSPGWWRYLAVGFLIGFGVWALKNIAFAAMGKFELVGWRDLGFALPLLGQAMFGMFVASFVNDLMIRGYGLAFCRRFHLMAWYVPITSVVYALDDSWNAGFEWTNLVFSLALGISLAYTVLKTGAIWMSIGIHWGGNVCFRIMSGFDGQGIARLEHVINGARFDYMSIAITALMFPVVVLLLRWMGGGADAPRSPREAV